jgi:glucokinase
VRFLVVACELAESCRAQLGTAPAAAGVAVPGSVDEAAGVALYSANIGWRDVPLRALLEERLALTAAVAHDVRAASIAEGALGAARGVRDYLFVGIGTGIGGGIVAGGQPLRGAHGLAGEIGHLMVRPDGPECACGARGCAETLASAAAIGLRYKARSGAGRDATAERVAELAAAGDPVAAAVWQEGVDALARALAHYVTLLDPEVIVIGGGLAGAGEVLLGPLRVALQAFLTFQVGPRILGGQLGSDAGCLGAALVAWRRAEGGPEAQQESAGQ